MAQPNPNTESLSDAAKLRDQLNELEKLLVKVNSHTVVRTLQLLDTSWLLKEDLRARGVDLKAEDGLWAGFEFRLSEIAGEIVKAANTHGGMAQFRQTLAQTDGFWWTLDELHAEQTRRTLFRWLRLVGGLAVLGLTVWILVTYVFPPDPNAVLITDIGYDIEKAVDIRDWDTAQTVAQAGLESSNNATEVLLWAAVIEERLNNPEQAADYVAKALSDSNIPPHNIWVTLGTNRLRAGDMDGAECAALSALATDSDNAQAHFLIASVAEAMGDAQRAVDYFNKTYDLAADGQPQLQVIARVRLGYLMQSPGSFDAQETEERELDCG